MAILTAKQFFGDKPGKVIESAAAPSISVPQKTTAPAAGAPAPTSDFSVKNLFTNFKDNVDSAGSAMTDQFTKSIKNVQKNAPRVFGDSGAEDQGSFGANFAEDLGKRLLAAGHIAGDIASTAISIPFITSSIVIPPEVKKDYQKSLEFVADKITDMPWALKSLNNVNEWWDNIPPENREAYAKDIPALLSLLGASKVSAMNPEIKIADLKTAIKSPFDDMAAMAGKAKQAVTPKPNQTNVYSKAVEQSTVGMEKMYKEALPDVKFDGTQTLPKQLTDHIVDDVARKFEMIYNLPDTGKVVRDTLTGKDFTSLGQIQTAVADTLKASGIEMPTALGSAGAAPLFERVRTVLSEKNVDPRVKSSAERLGSEEAITRQGIGETKVKKPIETYDEFFGQEQKFKGDIKQDMALGMVGDRIGTAFENVIKQRRGVGKVMETELKKIGTTPTDITDSFVKFETGLKESGLTYNGQTKTIRADKLSKVSSEDVKMLQQYVAELNNLGANPTIAELDAFLSRVPKEIDVYKAKNNVTQVTNGERLIKSNLSDLREQFSPDKTGNEALRAYYEARSAYADLSNFIEDGTSFLGKKTQSGDFAKDASLAKSSVQSILNNGKKDWLIQLEELTGYPALDESVLALQAMKDAGNFRGSSLLELISEGGLPTSQGGVRDRLINWIMQKGASAVSGTPDQQTRAFLRSLEGGN